MEELLKHHIGRNDLTGIRNCHMMGLHSIMLHNEEGNRVRIYVTTSDLNTISNYIPPEDDLAGISATERDSYRAARCVDMPLGLHGHRTEIRLHTIVGQLYNITADVVHNRSGSLRSYLYTSSIDGQGSRRMGPVNGHTAFRAVGVKCKQIYVGESVVMAPNQLHTVHTHGLTSWAVFERGEFSSESSSHFFSYNHRIPEQPEEGMYEPMTSDECKALLVAVLAAVMKGKASRDKKVYQNYQSQVSQRQFEVAYAAIDEAANITENCTVPATHSRYAQWQRRLVGHDNSSANNIALRTSSTEELLAYVQTLRSNRELFARNGAAPSITHFAEWAMIQRNRTQRHSPQNTTSSSRGGFSITAQQQELAGRRLSEAWTQMNQPTF